jgi:broad specificity phosphatase PhoE
MGQLDVPVKMPSSTICFPIIRGGLRIFVSPLLRCVQTVDLLLEAIMLGERFPLPLSIEVLPGLMERGIGDFEGRRKSDVYREYPHAFSNRTMDPEFCPPRGESFPDFKGRVLSAFGNVVAAEEKSTVLVCSHLQVLRLITIVCCKRDARANWSILRYGHGEIIELSCD